MSSHLCYEIDQQEYISVGYVPSTAVDVSGVGSGLGVSAWEGVCLGGVFDACENITTVADGNNEVPSLCISKGIAWSDVRTNTHGRARKYYLTAHADG